MEDFEKLGAFYLGRPYDSKNKKPKDGLLLYDSKDLVTHAVCVGMTGSGKTGLCIGLLEEAAIDGIPAIVIDPKGDLANLLLTFPDLQTEDFAPWINEDDAQKKVFQPADYAAQQAEFWKKGLARVGPGRRAHQTTARSGGVSHLHARQQRRHSRFDSQVVCRAAASDSRRQRIVARAREHHRHQSARPAGHRGRSDQEPRAHFDVQHSSAMRGRRAAIWTSLRLIQQIQTPPRDAQSA